MRKLFSATLLAVMLAIGLSAQAQTQEELEQEFIAYVNQYGVEATRDYALGRMAQMTTNAILEEAAWSLIERSFFGFSPCLATKQARCDEDLTQRLTQITVTTTVLAAACVLAAGAGGSPIASAICLTAVVIRHEIELRAAQATHRTCYRRAREDCPPPPPPPIPDRCAILGPVDITKPVDIGPAPLLPDCNVPDPDPCYCPTTPIMIDVAGNGFNLTNAANGVMFNITRRATEQLAWSTADSDDAFLALDLNGNGLIDNGAELFGNFTVQPEPAAGAERNGFAALAFYDYSADGKIDSDDWVYSRLRLWTDRNHNGISEPEELQPLDGTLKTLFLNYKRSKRVDEHGNEFRYRARVNDFDNKQRGRWAWDVFLVSPRSRPGSIGGLQWK